MFKGLFSSVARAEKNLKEHFVSEIIIRFFFHFFFLQKVNSENKFITNKELMKLRKQVKPNNK